MIKTLITAAFATVTLVAVAVPAQAQSASVAQCDSADYSISDNETTIDMQLQREGYNVTGIDEWNNCVRAFVVKADGSTGMVFFDPQSLQPVGGDYAKA